jgi:hypothetical protein
MYINLHINSTNEELQNDDQSSKVVSNVDCLGSNKEEK